MDEKKSGRWPELITIACTGWLLYSSIQDYQRYSALDIFSPEQLAEMALDHQAKVLFLVIILVTELLSFLVNPWETGRKLVDAGSSTVLLVFTLAYMWIVKASPKWMLPLALLGWIVVRKWREYGKVRREREMA